MGAITKLSEKFQISIPKEVRDKEGWKAGQEFAFVPHAGGVMLVPVPELAEMRGIARGANKENYRDRNDRY
jgi:AbrB family looped-hinge helix DNA binding protein